MGGEPFRKIATHLATKRLFSVAQKGVRRVILSADSHQLPIQDSLFHDGANCCLDSGSTWKFDHDAPPGLFARLSHWIVFAQHGIDLIPGTSHIRRRKRPDSAPETVTNPRDGLKIDTTDKTSRTLGNPIEMNMLRLAHQLREPE